MMTNVIPTPANDADQILYYETAGFIALALQDEGLVTNMNRDELTLFIYSLRYSDFQFVNHDLKFRPKEHEMTIEEAIAIVARKALADHTPTATFPYAPLALDAVIASANVRGRAGDLESRGYYADADNFVIDVAYADRGYRAMYEVGPNTNPILWAD